MLSIGGSSPEDSFRQRSSFRIGTFHALLWISTRACMFASFIELTLYICHDVRTSSRGRIDKTIEQSTLSGATHSQSTSVISEIQTSHQRERFAGKNENESKRVWITHAFVRLATGDGDWSYDHVN
jgi:hypothetical protein